MLAGMLALVAKDGMLGITSTSMLRDIFPYVPARDRAAIKTLLNYNNMASELTGDRKLYPIDYAPERRLSDRERFLALLNILSRYGGQGSREAFFRMRRYTELMNKMQGMGMGPGTPDLAGLFFSEDNAFSKMAPFLSQGMNPGELLKSMGGLNPSMLELFKNLGK